MACVSRNVRRTFHVPSGVPVQRSISKRDVSHPVVELGLTGLTSTSRSSRTTRSESLALLRSSGSVLSVRPRILSIKFWWFGYPCYDGPIAKAMDYTSKGELL